MPRAGRKHRGKMQASKATTQYRWWQWPIALYKAVRNYWYRREIERIDKKILAYREQRNREYLKRKAAWREQHRRKP
jgi:hypothetical protein